METVRHGDTVKVHYTGQLEDGTLFRSTRDRAPLEVTLGKTKLIPGVEQALIGMAPGESKTITVQVERMLDPTRERGTVAVSRDRLPQHVDMKVGEQLELRRPDGRRTVVRVSDVSESDVTLEANHFLVGGKLIFDITVVEILQA